MRDLFIAPGTFGGALTDTHSPVWRYLVAQGYRLRLVPWSYNVSGVPNLLHPGVHTDWIAGGYSFRFQLHALIESCVIDEGAIDVATHSHGIEPVIFQATLPPIDGLGPVPIRSLVSICAPPRRDTAQRYADARRFGMIGYHRAIYADGWDVWARAGQAFDGSWGWRREWAGADNRGLTGIGHAGLINDPALFPLLNHALEVSYV